MAQLTQSTSMYYRYWPDANRFQSLRVRPETGGCITTNGRVLGPDWKPPALEFVGDGVPFSDFPLLSIETPVFSERAFKALSPYLEGKVEAFSVEVSGSRYYLINVINVISCLDPDSSVIIRNPVIGIITWIERYGLHLDRIHQQYLFKIPESADIEVIVSAQFREIIDSHRFLGLRFVPLSISNPLSC